MKSWIEGNQQKSLNERVIAVQIKQPPTDIGLPTTLEFWYESVESVEGLQRDLENEIARTPEESPLVIDGFQLSRGQKQ